MVFPSHLPLWSWHRARHKAWPSSHHHLERVSAFRKGRWASLIAQLVKNPPTMCETWVRPMDWEDPLVKGKATHSSILAWRTPWTVWFMGSQRVGHN